MDGGAVLFADQVEVGEEQEDEVVVGADEAAPGGDVLHERLSTRMARMSISVRWVLSSCAGDSY